MRIFIYRIILASCIYGYILKRHAVPIAKRKYQQPWAQSISWSGLNSQLIAVMSDK